MGNKPARKFENGRYYSLYKRVDGKEVYLETIEEEPKPECDHIVGIAYQGALGFALKASEPIKNYIQKFNYCPECGEAITN